MATLKSITDATCKALLLAARSLVDYAAKLSTSEGTLTAKLAEAILTVGKDDLPASQKTVLSTLRAYVTTRLQSKGAYAEQFRGKASIPDSLKEEIQALPDSHRDRRMLAEYLSISSLCSMRFSKGYKAGWLDADAMQRLADGERWVDVLPEKKGSGSKGRTPYRQWRDKADKLESKADFQRAYNYLNKLMAEKGYLDSIHTAWSERFSEVDA